MNSCHSSGLYLLFIVADRSSTYLHIQTPSSPCVMNCSKYCWREKNAVTCTVFSRTFNCEVLKTTVVLYSSTAEGLWRVQKVLSARCCVVQQRLHSRKIPYCPLSGKSFLRNSFLNLETRASSKFLT
jgi:hypothetical protein